MEINNGGCPLARKASQESDAEAKFPRRGAPAEGSVDYTVPAEGKAGPPAAGTPWSVPGKKPRGRRHQQEGKCSTNR